MTGPLRPTTRDLFLQLSPCGHSPYVCLLRIGFAYVKRTYRTYSIGLHGYGECLSSQEAVSPIEVILWNEAPLMGFEIYLREEPHLYIKPCSCLLRSQSRLPMPFTSLVVGETCQQSCSLAMAIVLSPFYTAVTW